MNAFATVANTGTGDQIGPTSERLNTTCARAIRPTIGTAHCWVISLRGNLHSILGSSIHATFLFRLSPLETPFFTRITKFHSLRLEIRAGSKPLKYLRPPPLSVEMASIITRTIRSANLPPRTPLLRTPSIESGDQLILSYENNRERYFSRFLRKVTNALRWFDRALYQNPHSPKSACQRFWRISSQPSRIRPSMKAGFTCAFRHFRKKTFNIPLPRCKGGTKSLGEGAKSCRERRADYPCGGPPQPTRHIENAQAGSSACARTARRQKAL